MTGVAVTRALQPGAPGYPPLPLLIRTENLPASKVGTMPRDLEQVTAPGFCFFTGEMERDDTGPSSTHSGSECHGDGVGNCFENDHVPYARELALLLNDSHAFL